MLRSRKVNKSDQITQIHSTIIQYKPLAFGVGYHNNIVLKKYNGAITFSGISLVNN